MSALTSERNTISIAAGGMQFTRELEVASGSTIYAGAMTAVNSSGKAIPAASSGAITVVGRAENTASGGQAVKTRSGVFLYDNNTTSSAGVADIGKKAFVVDDHTVMIGGGSTSVVAGIIRDVTTDGVVLEVGNAQLN